MNNYDFILKQEEKAIINYVKWVLDFEHKSSEDTILLLTTKSYGILSPSIVFDLINRGVIIVIAPSKLAA